MHYCRLTRTNRSPLRWSRWVLYEGELLTRCQASRSSVRCATQGSERAIDRSVGSLCPACRSQQDGSFVVDQLTQRGTYDMKVSAEGYEPAIIESIVAQIATDAEVIEVPLKSK